MTRSILITGAASGIGAAIARRLAGPDTAMLLHTRRNLAALDEVAEQARQAGARVTTALADLADPGAAAALIGQALDAHGRLDVLISNAGFADRTPLARLTDEAMTASLEAIQGAFFRLSRSAIPHLAVRDSRIIAVSSFVAHSFRTDIPPFPASAAAKAGLEALVRVLAIELGPTGTTVNAVVPGFIRKDAGAHRAIDPEVLQRQAEKIPLGRIGLPDDVAAAVAFLASSEAGYITGQTLHVDGGLVIRG